MNYQKLKEGKGGSGIVEDKLVCLVGASGSGKTTLAKELEKLGYNIIESYTTRKEREKGEWGHIFLKGWKQNCSFIISPNGEEFFNHRQMIAFKKLYDEIYFATKEQYQGKGTSIYIVDPEGAEQVKANVKDAEVITIFLMADRVHRMGRLRGRFNEKNDLQFYTDMVREKELVLKFRDELKNRINKDREIFKTCKCDYVVDANREVEEVLKDVVDIIC